MARIALTLLGDSAYDSRMLRGIRVASPCTADWEQMTGNDRVRHCAKCDLDVYNFAAMTRREVAELVAASRGHRLCGRLYRRADGRVLTRDCPIGLRVRIRRLSRVAGAAISAAMGLTVAQALPAQHSPSSSSTLVQIHGQTGGIEIVVTDETGAVIPKAKVTILNNDGNSVGEGVTDERGQFAFPGLALGHYTVVVHSSGFAELKMPISIPTASRLVIPMQVELKVAMMGVIVEVTDPDMPLASQATSEYLSQPDGIPEHASLADQTQPTQAQGSKPRPGRLKHFFAAVGHKMGF